MSNPTFGDLRKALLEIGFQMTAAASHVLFEHGPARARLILQPFEEAERVDAATLAVVRRNLDERGILGRDRFEDWLRQRSLAG